MEIPRRLTLQRQAADLIRDRIRDGSLRGPLPGERVLAGQLHVSRVTIRLALAELIREGLLERVRRRYRPREAAGQPPRRRTGQPPRLAGYLCPHPMNTIMLRKMDEIYVLQNQLKDLAIPLTLVADPRPGRLANPGPVLEALVAETRAACWVLGLCPAPVQRWFARRSIPAVISGSAHEGVRLPYYNWDHRAIGRHAAGALRTRGHRRIALLTPASRFAGDLECEAGFLAGAGDSAPLILRHDGTPECIRRLVRHSFLAENRPTALACLHAMDAATALTTLMQAGLRVPGDAALVSLQGAALLEKLTPAVAHYEWRSDTLVNRLTAAVARLVAEKALPKPLLLMSRFYAAESIGPPRRVRPL